MAPPNDAAAMTPLIRDATAAALRPETPALQPNVGALLHDVARLIRRRFQRRARQTRLPINRQQTRALPLNARHAALSQAALATMPDIEPIALGRLLDRLQRD